MKVLDLSKVKVVGFIPNFNPKCGYPEFAYTGVSAVDSAPKYNFNTVQKDKVSKPIAKHIKNAKKAWKKAQSRNSKPVETLLLAFNAECNSSNIVWRTN